MEIAIQTNPLRKDTETIAEQLETLKKNMGFMNDEIQTLNTMWKGEANIAFVGQYLTDYEKMSELCKVLEDLIDCLEFAAKKYDECDNSVKNIVKSIRI